MIYWLTYTLANVFLAVALRLKVIGKKHIPRHGAFILATNHISNLDPVIIGAICPRRTGFFAKEELFRSRFLGWWLRGCDAFPVHRGKADRAALREAVSRLRSGRPLVFFPQGTRVRERGEGEVFPGVGFLVAKSGVPVVPAFIKGSDDAMPPGTKRIRRVPVEVRIGQPVAFSQEQSYNEISEGVMDAIYSLASAS